MPGKYTRSSGVVVNVDDLDYSHLRSAAEKLRRMGDPRGELPDMDARLADLEAAWRAEHPEGEG